MRGPALCLLLAALFLPIAGCMDGATSELALVVEEARLDEGDCAFGPRDEASDPEWCHHLVVQVENRHPSETADLSASSWSAQDDRFGSHGLPVVEGETGLEPGAARILILGFAAPEAVRLTRLHYEGTFGGVATARIPDYA